MKVRKVMIATPMKGGASASYLAGLLPVLHARIVGVEIIVRFLDGPSVNFARNELAHEALNLGVDEIVFIDEDMAWGLPDLMRILSHRDLDVVALIYCKKRPGRPFWLMNLKDGCDPDANGICEVNDIATGFMKISTRVFREMMERFPEREYYNKPEDGKTSTAWEFFPMGVVGPRSPEARLEKIKAVIAEYNKPRNIDPDKDAALWAKIEQAVTEKHGPGTLRGEDYYFCELARKCGFKIFADFGAQPVGHIGKISFPITPDMVGVNPAELAAK